MIYGSVCSGIEAATVAWHPLGWRPAFFAEIEAFPSAVLKHHYPDVRNVGDFTRLIDAAAPVPSIDVLVGGTPCQSFSVAGLRRGLADARGGLTLEFVRLAQRLRPKWIVWENVPGVLSQDGGRAFGAFLGALAELGYGWAYRVLDAQFFGVAQRRRRVFVVGCAGGDFARAASVLLEPEGVRRDPPTRRAAGEGASSRVAHGADERRTDGVICMAHGQGGAEVREDGAPSLTCNHEAPIVFDTTQITSALNRSALAHAPTIAFSTKDYGADASLEVSPTLRAGGHTASHSNGGVMPAVAFDARQSDTIVYGDRTGPLDTDGHSVGVCVTGDRTHALKAEGADGGEDGTGRGTPIVTAGMSVRRLTPVECERLQGFPDDYTRIQWKRKPANECPDGPRYKALGNSMAVPVMRWIGERIAKVEAV